MTERYSEWRPASVTGPTVALRALRGDDDGLVVSVDAGGQLIEIAFGRVVAFRSILEEACVDFWSEFHRGGTRQSPFWVVEDSAWLASFSEADLCLYSDARHYMIVTDEERIDVITDREPVARAAGAV